MLCLIFLFPSHSAIYLCFFPIYFLYLLSVSFSLFYLLLSLFSYPALVSLASEYFRSHWLSNVEVLSVRQAHGLPSESFDLLLSRTLLLTILFPV